jgi:hypothetical protein
MAIKAVKMLDMKFHIPLKLNDLPTSDVVGITLLNIGSVRMSGSLRYSMRCGKTSLSFSR